MSTVALPLAVTAVRSRSLVAKIALVIAGAGLIAACAQISIPLPFTPVPITGQTFAVLLVGTSLGLTLGVASTALYVAAGIAGAPIYADGDHGWSVITSASGGYLVGFVLASALVGGLARLGWDRRFGTASASMLAGNVIVYLVGLPWLAVVLNTDLDKTLEYGLYPFVVGDLVKLYLAAALLPAAWRLVQRLTR
ncbi:MAG: biotin transporter BioY [Actinobacteria bacterium]|nr:biotin transporter BioY [Actinomycetota bacterium]